MFENIIQLHAVNINSLNNCKDSRDLFVIAAAFANFFAVILLLIKHFLPSKSGNCVLYLFFNKQLGSALIPQSCLNFRGFWGSKLLNGCFVV